ncbi:MAG: DUF4364 family protein [Clostridia bacterium]|nr:DUF4364 family protein [Clostridia bacterium]
MVLNRKYIPDSENKLVILYALDRLGPVTGMQLLQFLVEMDLMNYFGMQLNLAELQEQQQVAERAHPLGGLLLITEKGAYTLAEFVHRIPSSRRELIDGSAQIWREKFRNEQQTLAESFPLSDGGTCIRLRLMEGDSALLDLLLTVPDGASMTFLSRRWRAAAQDVYRMLTMTLSDGFDPDAPLPDQPDTTSLQQAGGSSWLLSLNDRAEKPTMTLMLSMPHEPLARHYAARWPEQGETIRAKILRDLDEGLRTN